VVDEFGWIDEIRVFHDNKGDNPGWFVNYVSVTDPTVGLTWQADFYRWLAKDEADGEIDVTKQLPLDVSVSSGILRTLYLGFGHQLMVNSQPNPATFTDTFKSTYKKGVSVDITTTKSIKASIELGYNFFGIDSKFAAEANSLARRNNTTTEETLKHTQTWQVQLNPDEQITVVGINRHRSKSESTRRLADRLRESVPSSAGLSGSSLRGALSIMLIELRCLWRTNSFRTTSEFRSRRWVCCCPLFFRPTRLPSFP
jgi:PLAT/LH2 domain